MSTIVSCIFGWSPLDRGAFGLLGAGQRLAKQLDGKHCVLLMGTSPEATVSKLKEYADGLHLADHPLLAKYHSEITLTAMTQAWGSLRAEAILLGNDTYSQELTPRLAHRLTGSAAGDALSLEV